MNYRGSGFRGEETVEIGKAGQREAVGERRTG